MTREEQIKEAAYKRYCNSSSITFNLMRGCFEDGAKWADKTMIEKACEWLQDNLASFWQCKIYNDIAFVNDFKQAMEE